MAASAKDRKKARQMAEAIGPVGQHEVRDFKHALGLGKSLRLRQGYCFALEPSENSCSIWLSGEETTGVDGVRYFDVLPAPDFGVWCATDGEDIFVIASQGPAPSIKLSRSASQSISNTTPTNIIFQDPTVEANHGWDYWQAWTSGTSDQLWLPAPGVWELSGSLQYAVDADGWRRLRIYDESSNIYAEDNKGNLSGIYNALNCMGSRRVTDASNAYMTLTTDHAAGASLSVDISQGHFPFLEATWKGTA